jgi:SAM-dependent methyltransferase
MCNQSCLDFIRRSTTEWEVRGKHVIEIGSLDVNGSARQVIELMEPQTYIGVDITDGPGVDQVCDAASLLDRFGAESFDMLVSTEVIEHVRDWRTAIHNFKSILRPHGILLLTTRSYGYPYHGYPFDYWRCEPEDMQNIFCDLAIQAIDRDSSKPGVFVKALIPEAFCERALDDYELFSIITGRRMQDVSDFDIFRFKIWHLALSASSVMLPQFVKSSIRKHLYDPYRLPQK